MPPVGHSSLGASSAYRWLACPGSVALCADMPDKSSSYAKEGTAAHQLAEECLREGRNPHSYINGGTVTLEDHDGNQEEYEVSADMATAVFTYVQEIRDLSARLGVQPSLEQAFHLDWIDEDLWGTNDAMLALPFDTLHVYDYKHGQGVAVEVENNEQLMYYAIGALGNGNPNCHTDVELVIVQPRASHADGPIRRWKISVEDLYKWRDDVLVPGIAATRSENPKLCAGKHCRFCKAISVCPEVGKEAAGVAGVTAAQVFAPKAGENRLVFPHPQDLAIEQRVKLYEFAELFETWMKEVKADTHERMLAGVEMPGLKVVAGRASRKWRNEEEAKEIVVNELGMDAYTEPKLKSPAQVEKALKDIGANPKLFEDYIETVRGQSVVHESDKRPALPMGAAQVFMQEN